jgi:hypothetical protein
MPAAACSGREVVAMKIVPAPRQPSSDRPAAESRRFFFEFSSEKIGIEKLNATGKATKKTSHFSRALRASAVRFGNYVGFC